MISMCNSKLTEWIVGVFPGCNCHHW